MKGMSFLLSVDKIIGWSQGARPPPSEAPKAVVHVCPHEVGATVGRQGEHIAIPSQASASIQWGLGPKIHHSRYRGLGP